jgi:hypothetical protein
VNRPPVGTVQFGMVWSDGVNVATAKDFVHFLVSEGRLMH